MIKERHCSFKVSKLLQEKGFDEPCRSVYVDCGDYVDSYNTLEELTDLQIGVWEALRPTHQMAMDWLREKHGIFVQLNRDNQYHEGHKVTPMTKHDIERGHRPEYYARVLDAKSESNTTEHFDDFYDCVEAALEYCLTKLI